MLLLFLTYHFSLCFRHVTFYVETSHLDGTIGSNSNRLLKVTRELARTVIGYLNFALLAWLYRCLGVFGNGTSARGDSLIDYKGLLTNIRISECATYFGIFFRKRTSNKAKT